MEAQDCAFYRCADCPKVFEQRRHFNRHRKTHDRPYACFLCGRAFGLKTDCERHAATHGRGKLKCGFPGCKFKGTKRKDHFREHLQQIHQIANDTSAEENDRASYEEAIPKVNLADENQKDFDLLEAAREGDNDKMRDLLSKYSNASGTGLNGGDSHEQTLLHLAAKSGYENLGSILIEFGADINARSSSGETPLFTAIKAGHENFVKLLFQKGVDVHALSTKAPRLSALAMAVKYRHENIVKRLLPSSKDTHPVNEQSSGVSALFLAVRYGHGNIVKMLLQNGEDVHSVSKRFRLSVLSTAVTYKHKAIVNLLLDHGAIDEPDLAWANALMVAVRSNQEDMVALLLKRGADVNKVKSRTTPLREATKIGPAMTKLILDAKPDLEAKYASCTTLEFAALYYDPTSSKVETIKILINAGATITPFVWQRFTLELRKEYSHLSPFRPLDPFVSYLAETASTDEIAQLPSAAAGPFPSADTSSELGLEEDFDMDRVMMDDGWGWGWG